MSDSRQAAATPVAADRPAAIGRALRLPQNAVVAIAAVILAVAIAIAYGRAVDAPFIFDDEASVVENTSIEHIWPLIGDTEHPGPLNPPIGIPTASRPLVNLSLALNYYFGQHEPRGYHVLNIVLHVFAAMLLWAIVRRTLRLGYFQGRFDTVAGPLAFAAALVFALHPLASETVAYITQRTELMMGLFYLATFYGSLRYWSATRLAGRVTWLGLATLACLAGMLSKEMMVSAPVMALLYERTFIAGSFRRALRGSWPLYLGLMLGWIPLVLMNLNGPRIPNAGFNLGVPAFVWWCTQAKVLFLYLKLTFWPWPLVVRYHIPYLRTLSDAWPWLLAAGVAGIGTLWLLWRRTAAGFAIACAVAILSPTLVVPILPEVAVERRMYAPLAAIVPLVVVGAYVLVQRMEENFARRRGRLPTGRTCSVIMTVFVLGLAVVFGSVTARRLAAYHDELALWQDAEIHQPNDAVVQTNLGVCLDMAGQSQVAIEHFQRAVRLDPDCFEAHFNFARALDVAGQSDEAIAQYRETLRIKPDNAPAHNNLGILLANSGELPEAILHYQEALRLVPDFVAAHTNLAAELVRIGQTQKAILHYAEALRLRKSVDNYTNLMAAYVLVDRPADAIATAEKALELARSQGHADRAAQIESWLTGYRNRVSPR